MTDAHLRVDARYAMSCLWNIITCVSVKQGSIITPLGRPRRKNSVESWCGSGNLLSILVMCASNANNMASDEIYYPTYPRENITSCRLFSLSIATNHYMTSSSITFFNWWLRAKVRSKLHPTGFFFEITSAQPRAFYIPDLGGIKLEFQRWREMVGRVGLVSLN